MSTNYDFWKMAFDMKAIDKGILREAVVCKENPYGEITGVEFKEICGEDYIIEPVKPTVEPVEPIIVKPVEPIVEVPIKPEIQ